MVVYFPIERPEPKCSPVCTNEYNPQCGSDGKTYGNPSMMKYATCTSNGTVTLVHPGECSMYFSPSDQLDSVNIY